jgi:curli biogenesis system outer membrane secretion channel CsgG
MMTATFVPGFCMPRLARLVPSALLPLALAACALPAAPPQVLEASASRAQPERTAARVAPPAARALKPKIAIGRFSNETRYGRTFQLDAANDPLGKQASDMLGSRLAASGRFLVFERPDLFRVQAEQALMEQAGLIGVDTLILGSVTEFGRATTGISGFLSATKKQTAKAKVEIRLVDAQTGHVFFSATGSGDASTESGEVAGFGSRADYDGTLNDRAIGAAISDVLNVLMTRLEQRPWRTDILKVNGPQVYIAGGGRQGIKTGDLLAVMQQGETIRSAQTGFPVTLPASVVGRIRITSTFGDSDSNEGATAELIAGRAIGTAGQTLFIAEETR